MTAPTVARSVADRCPGLLRPHRAADGALVRLRLPGGRISPAALDELSAVSTCFGDGRVQLTSRANVQLRGVPIDGAGEVPLELISRLQAADLLPSTSHELVRNISCSPLTGLLGGLADLRPVIGELDRLICASAELAGLPGRFLFGLDDGRGDVAALRHDLGLQAVSADRAELRIADLTGPIIGLQRAAAALAALASGFVQARGSGPDAVWHVRELPGGGRELLPASAVGWDDTRPVAAGSDPIGVGVGVLRQDDRRALISVEVPLGLLSAAQVDAVTDAAAPHEALIVTPWRGLVLPNLAPDAAESGARRLSDTGLSLDDRSGWRGLTACAGAPGCTKAAAATGPVAALLAGTAGDTGGKGTLPVHVVACERRCGAPSSDHVEVLLVPAGAGPRYRTQRRPAGPGRSPAVRASDSAGQLGLDVGLARNDQ